MGQTLFQRLTSLKNSYLVFIAALLVFATAVGLYIFLSAKATSPAITYTRSNTTMTVKATFPANSSYQYKFLDSGLVGTPGTHYWKHVQVNNPSNCHNNAFTGALGRAVLDTTNSQADRRQVTVTITGVSTSATNYYCLQTLYGLVNNDSSILAYYNVVVVDNTKPAIALTQVADELRVQVVDSSDIATWEVASAAYNAAYTACTNSAFSYSFKDSGVDNDFSVTQKKATLTLNANGGLDHDKLFCFRVADNQGNAGVSMPLRIDLVAPTLVSDQLNAVLTVDVTNTSGYGHTDIDVSSWQYKVIHNSICNDTLTAWNNLSSFNKASLSKTRATITLSSSDNNRHYCFRVADTAANYGYAHRAVTPINSPPTISSPRQSKQKVVATAHDSTHVDSSSWRYAITNSSTCDSSVSSSAWSTSALTTSNNRVNASTVTVDLSNLSIDESLSNKWICLRVADNIADNYGYRSLDIDASGPQINVRQDHAVLRATSASNQGAVGSSWNYVSNETVFTCNQSAFDFYKPVHRSSVVSLNQQSIGDYFCFRVADGFDNHGYSELYLVSSLDTTKPQITASQANDILIIKAAQPSQIKAGTYGYVNTGETANRVVCNDDDNRSYSAAPSNLRVQLSESHIGFWFCVRASDLQNNYGYYPIKILDLDATSPVVLIVQHNDVLVASSSAADINNSTWQYAVLTVNDNLDCSARNKANLNFNAKSANNARVKLTTVDHLRYYCFRVADNLGNETYALSDQISEVNPAPHLVVQQDSHQKTITVSTDDIDVDGLTWGWAVFSVDPGQCETIGGYMTVSHSALTRATRQIIIRDIADSQNGSYYCFRVADRSNVSNPNYGYAKHRYDLVEPTIRFSYHQQTRVLTVFARDNDIDKDSWRYASFRNKPANCRHENINHRLPSNQKLSFADLSRDIWLCFKVSDQAGNEGYAVYGVGRATTVRAPKIDVEQTTKRATATSTAADLVEDTWRYALTIFEPNCRTINYGPSNSTGSGSVVYLTEKVEEYDWICFSVENTSQKIGYAKHQIDRTAPTIKIVQNNIVLELSSPDDDVDKSTWGYVKSETPVSCGDSIRFKRLRVDNGEISFDLQPSDSSWYFCFRLADRVGNTEYKQVQVHALDLSAPLVKLKQVNTVLRATAQKADNNSWQYVRSSGDINCSDRNKGLRFNTPKAANSRLQLRGSDNGHWFCFKVVGKNSIEGYAKILVNNVDARRPKVSVSKEGQTLMARADEEIKTWQHVVVSKAEDCKKAAFAAENNPSRGNEVTLTVADDRAVYCFRALDATGNAGYKAVTVVVKDTAEPTPPPTTQPPTAEEPTDEVTETDDENRLLLIIGGIVVSLLAAVIIILVVMSSRRPPTAEAEGFDDDYTQYQ